MNESLKKFLDALIGTGRAVYSWIGSHKKIVFLYIPILVMTFLTVYTIAVYSSWRADRAKSFEKLAKYKQLIDRTEDLKAGYSYNYSEVDLSAKVVDIPTRIYDRNNEIIGEFFEQKREIVPYSFIPKHLVNAVIASEDRDFYKHKGFSAKGIFRAFLTNILHLSVIQGGSTISQQLAKVLFTDMDRSLKRKIYETFCALEIEKRYDKADIMSMYLNLIYFGNGAYGVESAAKMFFGKSVSECNEVECAMIVATISSPKAYSPLLNLNNSLKKTKRILKSLVDAKYITEARAEYNYSRFLKKWDFVLDKDGNAKSSLVGSFIYSSYHINRSPFFNELVRRILVEKFTEDVVKRGGLKVYTTIDAAKQDVALKALRAGVSRQRSYHVSLSRRSSSFDASEREKSKAENIEGALISINPFNGEILAYVGGSEFNSTNQLDCVSQIQRQPGSSIKPIVYAAALEAKDITPSMAFEDKRMTFSGDYSPQNYDGKYTGKMIVRQALARSVNVVAVQVLDKTGYGKIFDILKKALNLSTIEMHKRFSRTLSFALGTYEISPLENCILHALLVNGGQYILPYGIKQVKDYNDNVVWNNEEEMQKLIEERRKDYGTILDPAAAAVTVSMLKGVVERDGTAPYIGKMIKFPVAGKTGTTSKYSDAWFVGYTAANVTAVWIGNKKGSISLGSGRSGSSVAAPVWAEYIASVYRDNPQGEFPVPPGVVKENICIESGKVANKEHTTCSDTAEQLFMAGTEPGDFCDLHRKPGEEGPEGEKSEKSEKPEKNEEPGPAPEPEKEKPVPDQV